MEIKQLNYFKVVATLENMSKAAKELHVAQPAISQSIARLEAELGVTLFDRIGKTIKLNRQGMHLMKSIPKMLEPFEKIKSELAQVAISPLQEIHILVLSSSVLIPSLLKSYVEKYPNTKFVISQSPMNFDYDLCITSVPLDEEVYEGTVVFEEEIFMAIPLTNPLIHKADIIMKDILQEEYITLSQDSVFSKILHHYFEKSKINPKTTFEVESPNMLRGLIEAELGIAFYPKTTWKVLTTKEVVLRKITDVECGRKIVIKVPVERQQDYGLKCFFNHIVEFYENL